MADDYRTDGRTRDPVPPVKSGMNPLVMLLILAVVVVGVLFATGFWTMGVTGGSMPKVDVSAKGGSLPNVDVHSKTIVVGSTPTTVDVPKIDTKKATINVPTVGVKP